uniref:Peptidase S8/S53 domain-containing protein n=1 Tax=Bionectria ochroleuca TaxID=29856 RepID=A0A8H7K4F8_BIOOC
MWKIARRLLLLVCLLCTVSCHQKKHGHYHVVLKDHPETKLHDHICWVNKINQDSGSGHFGVKSYYECSIGKGYFAHLSDKIAKDIEESDEVLHIVQQSTLSFTSAPSKEDIIVDDKMDPKNWALTAISSSNPPKRKNEYKYHKSQATGTYIYIVDSGIQSDDREFEGRVVHGYGYADPYDLQSATNGGDLSHGTFVAGIAGGVRHGVAKNTALVDVNIGADFFPGHELWDSKAVEGICWAADHILQHKRTKKSVINFTVDLPNELCPVFHWWLRNMAKDGITVVGAAGNNGIDVKDNCMGSPDIITVGAYDKDFNAWNFSNYGTGVDIWAPGVNVRSVLSQAVLDKKGRRPWPKDTEDGTSFAAPHVAGIIAGWMGETEEGLSPVEVREKLDELSLRRFLKPGDLIRAKVPEKDRNYRLANSRIAYNGADGPGEEGKEKEGEEDID